MPLYCNTTATDAKKGMREEETTDNPHLGNRGLAMGTLFYWFIISVFYTYYVQIILLYYMVMREP
jgi:hypothetical protein